MRVEGQGMAVDSYPVKNETAISSAVINTESDKKNTGSADEDQQVKKTVPTYENISAAVDIANHSMKISDFHLEFRLHEKSGRYQVKVVDDNGKVVRELPPDAMLDFSAKIKEMLDKHIGLLVDEHA